MSNIWFFRARAEQDTFVALVFYSRILAKNELDCFSDKFFVTDCMRSGLFLQKLLKYWTVKSDHQQRIQINFKQNIQNRTRLKVPPFDLFQGCSKLLNSRLKFGFLNINPPTIFSIISEFLALHLNSIAFY